MQTQGSEKASRVQMNTPPREAIYRMLLLLIKLGITVDLTLNWSQLMDGKFSLISETLKRRHHGEDKWEKYV